MKRNRASYACLLSLVTLLALTVSQEARAQQQQYTPAPDNYADLGDPEDEKFHELRGWSGLNAVLPRGMALDRTSRYQSLRRSNSVRLFVQQVGTVYNLTIRSEAGACDDSFEVYVNNSGPLYVYKNKEQPVMKALHQMTVDASLINDTSVEVTFRNISEDGCGRAAISYVLLEPAADSGAPQPSVARAAPIKLQRALEMIELFVDREQIDVTGYIMVEAKLLSRGERYWRVRWEKEEGERGRYLEFTVSADGIVAYKRIVISPMYTETLGLQSNEPGN